MVLRSIIATLAALALVVLAFLAGYAAYPLIHLGAATSLSGRPDDARIAADMGRFWQVWSLLEADFYGQKPPVEERTYGAIDGMVRAFDDPYTVFVEPQTRELERDQLAGRFGGIGATVEDSDVGFLLRPLPGQPADRAGLLSGDLLLLVDDKEVTPDLALSEVVALLRGPIDSVVSLAVRRQTDADHSREYTFDVRRVEIMTPSLEWRLLDENPQTADIGYLRQTLFTERSAEEMRQALADLTAVGAERFIWDLRGNPGGLLNAAVEMVDMWLDEGSIVVEEKAGGLRKTFEATQGTLVNAPLILIVDGSTASSSEIVAGALQDHGRARLIGERTFGKGSVQLIHELADHSSLHVTNAEWLTPSGHRISGRGLNPDVAVGPDEDPLAVAIGLLPAVQQAQNRTE